MKLRRVVLLLFFLGGLTASPPDSRADGPSNDHRHPHPALAELDLEQLMDIEVVTPGKRRQSVKDTSAAVYVLTAEDITRSGARTIPDILRLVPGLQVAQIDANTWSVTIRGFGGRFANKLLVLVDGRSIYTPLFSGVYWDAALVPVQDIERIEVVRGPGGSVWGANAVNGVINIITVPAGRNRETHVTLGSGNLERAGHLHHGQALGPRSQYRVDVFGREHDSLRLDSGRRAGDQGDALNGLFRLDFQPDEQSEAFLQAGLYSVNSGGPDYCPTLTPPYGVLASASDRLQGGFLHALYRRQVSREMSWMLQGSYSRDERNGANLDEDRDRAELEFQHDLQLAENHFTTWGLHARQSWDSLTPRKGFYIDDRVRKESVASLFVQDEIHVLDGLVRVTPGTKFEYYEYEKFNLQPSLRAALVPNNRQTLWASVSRAVRNPSRAEDSFRIDSRALPAGEPYPVPALFQLRGSSGFDAEELTAWEAGYRVTPSRGVYLDLSVFYHEYKNLRSFEPGAPEPGTDPVPHLVIPILAQNRMNAETYGAEVACDYRLTPWWKIRGGYTLFRLDAHADPSSLDTTASDLEGTDPRHTAFLGSMLNLPSRISLDLWARYVDTLPTLDADAYIELDARLCRRIRDHVSLCITGRNLLDEDHREHGTDLLGEPASRVERSVFVELSMDL